MTDKERGKVFAEYWVRCGRCGHETILDAIKRRVAVEEVRERGWRHTHDDGWICSACQSSHPESGIV